MWKHCLNISKCPNTHNAQHTVTLVAVQKRDSFNWLSFLCRTSAKLKPAAQHYAGQQAFVIVVVLTSCLVHYRLCRYVAVTCQRPSQWSLLCLGSQGAAWCHTLSALGLQTGACLLFDPLPPEMSHSLSSGHLKQMHKVSIRSSSDKCSNQGVLTIVGLDTTWLIWTWEG